MSLKKIWNKITNNQKYQEFKYLKQKEKNIKLFKNKFEEEINQINKKINKQHKLNFYTLVMRQI